MRLGALVSLFALLTACSAAAAAGTDVKTAITTDDRQSFDQISRGRYLANLGDCSGCHTVPGGKPYAGGLRLDTPFGPLIAPNLTPDAETGIGSWSDDDFVNAVTKGVGRGGTHIYPAMPYTYYTKMSRDDVLAIRAFLNTLEPVRNPVVANQLPFPFDIRFSLVGWNWLYFTPGEFKPVAGKSAQWNRGAYIVEGPGHCGVCHTPKNWAGSDESSNALQGDVLLGWFAPDLKDDQRTGLSSWSTEDIVSYLKIGHNRTSFATGPMAEVITDSTSHLSDNDLAAIATYLKDQPPASTPSPTPVAADTPAMREGAAIYIDNCAACHTASGAGVANIFPALKGNPTVQAGDPTTLIRVVLHGTRNVATDPAPTGSAMPRFDWKLNDAQTAAVITYIRNNWGNAAPAVSADDVKKLRQENLAAAP